MSSWPGKISILVPVYNALPFLQACADSVLAQGDANYELVLVDDGSTDGGGALADALMAAHPAHVRVLHQPNRGLIMARRQGIALAAGEFCMFLDADDMLAAHSLAAIRQIIGETGADIVIFNYDNLYEPTGERETDEAVFPDGSLFEGEGKKRIYEELIRSWRLNNLCMKAIRTPLVREDDTPYEDYAHLQIGEDLLQSLYPVTHAARIAYCAKPLYIYRHTRESMIGGAGGGSEGGAINAQLEAYMARWGMDTERTREMYAQRRLGNVLTFFFQAYRAAKTPAQRRAVVAADWRARIPKLCLPYVSSPALGWKKRLQLWALLHRNRPLLWLFEWLGGRKLRRQYGK